MTLLNDEIDVKEIERNLSLYFRDNASPETSPGTLWEAHKALIRGKLIELGARKKRERTHLQSALIKEIGTLEQTHKHSNFKTIFHALTKKREELKALFHSEYISRRRVVDQQYYEWGNKPSRILARSLQQRKSASFIAKIKTTSDINGTQN